MRILFWGTPEFAVLPLRALLGEGHDVVGVVTQPDKPRGRSRTQLDPSPVKVVALEEGLPVLRSTTTGISAVIDAHGTVRQHIPMHRAANIEGKIPPAAPPTLFSRWGNALPLAWALVAMAASLVAMTRRRR